MRCTGRTTKMLLRMIEYLVDNHGKQKTILFVTHSFEYSHQLMRKLCSFYEDFNLIDDGTYLHGNTLIFVASFESLHINPRRFRGIKLSRLFCDHYTPRGVWINLGELGIHIEEES